MVVGSIPGFNTLNRGPMAIFQDILLIRTYCDKAGDYAVPNVLGPDLSDINWTIIKFPCSGHIHIT